MRPVHTFSFYAMGLGVADYTACRCADPGALQFKAILHLRELTLNHGQLLVVDKTPRSAFVEVGLHNHPRPVQVTVRGMKFMTSFRSLQA
jgi:hypothetical protein